MIYFRLRTKDGLVREAAVPFTYPGGERHLKELPGPTDPDTVWIADVRFSSDGDTDLTYAHAFGNVAHQRQQPFVLMLPYLPAARSDRSEPPGGEPVGAVVYHDRVKAMNPQQVIGIDAHSPFIQQHYRDSMPGKLTVLDPYPLLETALQNGGKLRFSDDFTEVEWCHYDAIIAPDKGAVVRAEYVADRLGIDCYHAEKHRDFKTGVIDGIAMTEQLPASGSYLVVDDICDGGRTFRELAIATGLHRDRLGLWVTHGIFSGHAIDLRQGYTCIMTSDSHTGYNNFGDRFSATKHNTERVHIADVVVPCETYMLHNMKEVFA